MRTGAHAWQGARDGCQHPEHARQAALAFRAGSLDAPLPDSRGEDHSLSDVLGAEDPDLERTLDMEAVRAHWAELPEREQELLCSGSTAT